MADLLKILRGKHATQPETEPTAGYKQEEVEPSPQIEQVQETAAPASGNRTSWGIPIADGWNTNDPVFQRHPMECDCYRQGVLRCGVPCVWAWPPGSKVGDKALVKGRG